MKKAVPFFTIFGISIILISFLPSALAQNESQDPNQPPDDQSGQQDPNQPPENQQNTPQDSDQDQIYDDIDQCPNSQETFNNYLDDDGCPDQVPQQDDTNVNEETAEKSKEKPISIVPGWIKNNAKWWSEGKIGDSDFITGIQYLIDTKTMKVPETKPIAGSSHGIPSWIKNTAGWWASGLISEKEFVDGVGFLVKSGVLTVTPSSGKETEVVFAKSWKVLLSDDAKGKIILPMAIASDASGNLFVLNPYSVDRYDQSSHKWNALPVCPCMTAKGINLHPIALDKSGNLYVGDRDFWQIEKFSPITGKWSMILFDEKIVGDRIDPSGIAVDSSNNIYVSDSRYDRILKYSNKLGSWSILAESYTKTVKVAVPRGMAIDSSDNLYVGDGGTIFEYVATTGTWKDIPIVLSDKGVHHLGGIAVDSSGIYIADPGKSLVAKLSFSTGEWSEIASKGSGLGSVDKPIGVAVDSYGHLYIADQYNHRILKFTP